jgi:hypothetical protein
VIRTAHAARGLARRETPERRGELARALAYWAASYQELPASDSRGPRAATFEQALEKLPLYRDGHDGRAPGGNIVNGLKQAGALAGFDSARDAVALSVDVSGALSALTATFARAYLRHGAQGGVATIAFVHGVTGPCALRRLMPYLKPETARAALPYAWQAAAGIYSAYARRDAPPAEARPGSTREELAARAVGNGDEHAIKFTEALLEEHALTPDPVYLAAAEDAVRRL